MQIHDVVREKLARARAAFEDDAKTDHAAVGHLLDLLELQAGIKSAENLEAEPDPGPQAP